MTTRPSPTGMRERVLEAQLAIANQFYAASRRYVRELELRVSVLDEALRASEQEREFLTSIVAPADVAEKKREKKRWPSTRR
jgi:hypothetical protein